MLKSSELDLFIWSLWLDIRALSPSIVAAFISAVVATIISRAAYRRNVRPVLVFTKRDGKQWQIENVGSGPAINILVGPMTGDNAPTYATKYEPIGARDKAPIFVRGAFDMIAATYSDIDEHHFTTEYSAEKRLKIYSKNKYPKWEILLHETELQSHSVGEMDPHDLARNALGRIIDKN